MGIVGGTVDQTPEQNLLYWSFSSLSWSSLVFEFPFRETSLGVCDGCVSGQRGDKMKTSQELIDLIEIAQFSQESQFAHLPRVRRAKWAVEEIRRLRAKVNRMIRVENAEDADGNYVAQQNAQPDDLILEEEI
jgi:hypothetical protein